MEIVSRTAEQVFIPLTVGGGVGSVEDVDRLLRAGADKVGGEHRRDPPARAGRRDRRPVRQPGAGALGRRRAARAGTDSGFEVTTHGGRTSAGPGRRRVGRRGPPSSGRGRSCSTRWTPTAPQDGFDLELIRAVRREVSIPVIASGGAGAVEHFAPGGRRGRRRRARRERLPLRHARRSVTSRQALAERRPPGAVTERLPAGSTQASWALRATRCASSAGLPGLAGVLRRR